MNTLMRPILCYTLTVLFMLWSCTTDSYDKGNGKYSLLQAELANIHVGADLRIDYLTTDDDQRLQVANPLAVGWMKTPDTTYRAVAYFNRKEEGAEIIGINRVGVAVPKKIDTLKTDPVRFESLWMGHNGQYLNASIYLLTGTADDENAIQRLGCCKDTLIANADGSATQRLTLYHDQGGVPEYYSQRTYLSIPMKGIKADSVSIAVNTYTGVVRRTLKIED